MCIYAGALIWYYGFSDPATLPFLYLSTGGWALCILRMLARLTATHLSARHLPASIYISVNDAPSLPPSLPPATAGHRVGAVRRAAEHVQVPQQGSFLYKGAPVSRPLAHFVRRAG